MEGESLGPLSANRGCAATCTQGRRLRGDRGIVPLKKLDGWDGSAFIPPIFRKCLADLQCKNE